MGAVPSKLLGKRNQNTTVPSCCWRFSATYWKGEGRKRISDMQYLLLGVAAGALEPLCKPVLTWEDFGSGSCFCQAEHPRYRNRHSSPLFVLYSRYHLPCVIFFHCQGVIAFDISFCHVGWDAAFVNIQERWHFHIWEMMYFGKASEVKSAP